MRSPIVIGVDPTRLDRAPVDFGIAVARLTGAPLVIAVVQSHAPVVALSQGQSLDYALVDDDLIPDASEAVQELEAEVKTLGFKAEVRLLRGTSAPAALHVTADQEHAALLVVGSHRDSRAGRVRAGSTAARLLHGAPCPVAVVPQGWTLRGVNTVGAGFTDTEEGHEALRAGHAVARRAHASLRAITVVKPTAGMRAGTEPTKAGRLDRADLEDVEGEHKLVAERALRRAVEDLDGDVAVEVEALVGDPAEVLVDVSGNLDLLVCGSRGYGPVRRVLLGGVVRRLIARAASPVVVVPRGAIR